MDKEVAKHLKHKQFHLALLKQMITLATSGFGLVAALAWNNVVQELVANYIKPYLPQGSSVISLFLYAIIITIFAVAVTYQLTLIIEQLENRNSRRLQIKK